MMLPRAQHNPFRSGSGQILVNAQERSVADYEFDGD
jgi:hypothetical protein